MRRYIAWLIIIVTGSTAEAQLPPPPDQINLNIPGMSPPPMQAPAQPQYNTPQTQVIRPVSVNSESIKAGSVVRVRRQTVVRSRPTDHAYVCNTLPAGSTVTLLELPKPGSEYATIATPDNCYSLVPSSSLYMLFPPKNFKDAPQPIKSLTEPLIDGEPGVGAEYVGSGTKLQKGTQVDVVNEKKIMVHGKVKNYVVIRSSGKDVRFIRTADLEGVEEAARQAQVTFPASPLNTYQQPGYQQQQPPPQFNNNTNNNSMWLQQGQGSIPVPEGEQLPPALAGQVQSADQAYQMALRSGAWEDARMRYQYLMEADVMSVRILAKNRLEFIREWQANPPAQPVAQQQAGYLSPAYNAFAWVPGDGSAFRTHSTAMNTPFGNSVNSPNPTFGNVVAAAPRETVIKPTPPVTNPAASQVKIPTYQDQQLQQPASIPPQQFQPQTNPVAQQPQQQRLPQQPISTPAAASASGKWIGKLNKAVQYNAGSQLYYLTNSQGLLVHYLRGNNITGPQLASQVGRIVEVEGSLIKVPMDGQMKDQINAVTVRPKN